jgi:hypothetical protein
VDRVAVLRRGYCVALETSAALRSRLRRVEVDLPRGLPERFALEGCLRVEVGARGIVAVVEAFDVALLDRLRALRPSDIRVLEMTLDEIVAEVVRKAEREEAA